jgi:hypothetical protein
MLPLLTATVPMAASPTVKAPFTVKFPATLIAGVVAPWVMMLTPETAKHDDRATVM